MQTFLKLINRNIRNIIAFFLLILISATAWSNDFKSVADEILVLQERLQQLQDRIMRLKLILQKDPDDETARSELNGLVKKKENTENKISLIKSESEKLFKPNAKVVIEERRFGVMYTRPRKFSFLSDRVNIDRKGYYLKKDDRVQLLDEKYVTLFMRYHYGKVKYRQNDFVDVGWVRIGNGDEYWYWIKPDNPKKPYE